MRRREFITLGGASAAWSLVAHAQQPAMPVIGFLNPTSPDTRRELIAAFHQGLAEAGYVEGRNLTIEYRWTKGQNDRLPAMATDLVQRRVAVIAAVDGTATALAAKAATATIPILFLIGADPVELGLVASLNRPGGNITGVSALSLGTVAKRLQLLHELVPAAADIAFLRNPTNPYYVTLETRELQSAATALGLRLLLLNASTTSEIEVAFTTLVEQRADAFLLGTDPFFMTVRDQLVALANRHALPAIYPFREDAVAGGLMSYGTNLRDGYRLIGGYTGRILSGDKPADLPVLQATKFELVINAQTAKALGISIPLPLLGRADEVIE
jgi:putative tryptophan/tyrosine transport system substrate-binding protein